MRKGWIIGGIVLVGLAAAYTGYWFWLAQTFEQNLALWVDQQRAMGYRVSYAAGEPHGFPFRATIDLADVRVASPAEIESWEFSAASMRLGLAPWRPMTLRIQQDKKPTPYHLQWSASGQSFELVGGGIETAIAISGDATPPAIAFTAKNLDLREGGQSLANTLRLSVEIAPADAAAADGSVAFALRAELLKLVVGPPSKPEYKEVYFPNLKGRIIGPIPVGSLRDALAQWSTQGGYLEITNVSANSADGFPPRFEGTASIALDRQLQPIVAGTVTVRDYDYVRAIDRAVADGHVTPTQGTAAKLWLSAKAEKDNGGLKVTLPLTIQDGLVSMGSIKLARMPRIEWQ
jgi:hypothetical protein